MNRSGCIRWLAGILILALLASLAFLLLVRPWYLNWGASPAEIGAALPGDENIPAPEHTHTRAITVRAPAEQVWPWIAQMEAEGYSSWSAGCCAA